MKMKQTYIHSSHSVPKSWSDDSNLGLMAPVSKGERLIIVHAGGRFGFIPNALLIYKSQVKTGDFHKEMNTDNYVKWLRTMLIPNLPPNSVLVIDNASYHNTQLERSPTSNSLKKDMLDWLARYNIQYDERSTKTKLYDLILANKPAHKTYLIDQILTEHGHSILRLPPYHPDLNPIELIWGDVKQWVGIRNVTFKLKDVEALCRQRFDQIGEMVWENVCRRVEENEQHYWEKDGMVEERIERIILEDNGMESSDEEKEEEEEEVEEEDQLEEGPLENEDVVLSGVEEIEDD